MTKILIVEDDTKIASILEAYMKQEGFEVGLSHRGDTVIDMVRGESWSLILLDLMLPGNDGISVCREIRTFSQVPIIMVTARIAEIDRLLGLELGADDYICKPFSPREVVARVKAVLRRSDSVSGSVLIQGPLQLDLEKRSFTIDAQDVKLTAAEFDILAAMLEQPERVFRRSELLYRVRGNDFSGYERNIDSHVKNLRRKIALLLSGDSPIESVYGVGYRFNMR